MDSTSGNYLSLVNRIPPSVRAFLLFLVTLFFRIPFRSHVLFNWDSVNYALGIRDFNIFQHRPHPPGYILYIWAGKWITQLTKDPNASLVWISIFSSAIAVAATYLFARRIFKERDAIFSAALLLASPLFWLYDETALNYDFHAGRVRLLPHDGRRRPVGLWGGFYSGYWGRDSPIHATRPPAFIFILPFRPPTESGGHFFDFLGLHMSGVGYSLARQYRRPHCIYQGWLHTIVDPRSASLFRHCLYHFLWRRHRVVACIRPLVGRDSFASWEKTRLGKQIPSFLAGPRFHHNQYVPYGAIRIHSFPSPAFIHVYAAIE
jgi:hypothetical protein